MEDEDEILAISKKEVKAPKLKPPETYYDPAPANK
jgi:hypothetical protein